LVAIEVLGVCVLDGTGAAPSVEGEVLGGARVARSDLPVEPDVSAESAEDTLCPAARAEFRSSRNVP
jgi:hypothetical protein